MSIGRRDFCWGALSGTAIAGCHRRGTTLSDVDPDIGKRSHTETIAVAVPIPAARQQELHQRLEAHVLDEASPGVHFARLLPIPNLESEPVLVISSVYDGSVERLVDLLHVNAPRVDPVFSLAPDYPAAGARDPEALRAWLSSHALETLMLYSAFSRASESAIREAIQLRTEFLRFVQSVQNQPEHAEVAYTAFLEANRARIDTHREGAVDELSPTVLTAPEAQNPFTMVFDLRPEAVARFERTLRDGEWTLEHLHIHPLSKIPTVHYARFARLTTTRIVFESVYDGEWDQYLTDFSVNIPEQLDLIWGGAVGYPKGGAKDAPALAAWLDSKRIPRDYFFSANGDTTVKAVLASLKLGAKLVRFSEDAPSEASRLVTHVERFVHAHQELLG